MLGPEKNDMNLTQQTLVSDPGAEVPKVVHGKGISTNPGFDFPGKGEALTLALFAASAIGAIALVAVGAVRYINNK